MDRFFHTKPRSVHSLCRYTFIYFAACAIRVIVLSANGRRPYCLPSSNGHERNSRQWHGVCQGDDMGHRWPRWVATSSWRVTSKAALLYEHCDLSHWRRGRSLLESASSRVQQFHFTCL